MNILYYGTYTLSLMTVSLYGGCFDFLLRSSTSEKAPTITTIHVEAAKQKQATQRSATPLISSKQQTLQVPDHAVRPHSTTTSDIHARSTVVSPVYAYPGRSDSASSAGLAPISATPTMEYTNSRYPLISSGLEANSSQKGLRSLPSELQQQSVSRDSRADAGLVPISPQTILIRPSAPTPAAARLSPASPQTVLLSPHPTPEIVAFPSTPLTPITPLSDSSASSPGSPLLSPDRSPFFEPERIITYPEDIRDDLTYSRYHHAVALAAAFKKELPIINDKQRKNQRINAHIYDVRADIATTMTECCATRSRDDFPCIITYRDPRTGEAKQLKIHKEQYEQCRIIGCYSYGRSLTQSEIDTLFNIVGLPEELCLQEFSHTFDYDVTIDDHTRRHYLTLKQDRLDTLQQLIPKHTSPSANDAERIMQMISIKLEGPGRSLRQFMAAKASTEAREQLERAEADGMLSLTESAQILEQRVKPYPLLEYHH